MHITNAKTCTWGLMLSQHMQSCRAPSLPPPLIFHSAILTSYCLSCSVPLFPMGAGKRRSSTHSVHGGTTAGSQDKPEKSHPLPTSWCKSPAINSTSHFSHLQHVGAELYFISLHPGSWRSCLGVLQRFPFRMWLIMKY